MKEEKKEQEVLSLVSNIVACYVSNHKLPPEDLHGFIKQVYRSLTSIENDGLHLLNGRPDPFVPIDQSIHPDYIVCLEDGRRLKMLKRHLRTNFNLTPYQYRERWGLAPDYPMVAPNYTKKRSNIAKDRGLGKSK